MLFKAYARLVLILKKLFTMAKTMRVTDIVSNGRTQNYNRKISDILVKSKPSHQVLMHPVEFIKSLRCLHDNLDEDEWGNLGASLWVRGTGFTESMLEIVGDDSVYDNITATVALDFIKELGIKFLDKNFDPVDYLESFNRYVHRKNLNAGQQHSILDCLLLILTGSRKTGAYHDFQILCILINMSKEVREASVVHKLLDVVYELSRYVFGTKSMLLENESFLNKLSLDWIWFRNERVREMAINILLRVIELESGRRIPICLQKALIKNWFAMTRRFYMRTNRELEIAKENEKSYIMKDPELANFVMLRGIDQVEFNFLIRRANYGAVTSECLAEIIQKTEVKISLESWNKSLSSLHYETLSIREKNLSVSDKSSIFALPT